MTYSHQSIDDLDGSLVGGLLVLLAVAETQAFVRAAERIGLTQSGVSRAIARLEHRLSTKLVQRTSRHVELTEAGTALLDRVGPHLSGISKAAAELAETRGLVKGKLRVNVDAMFSRLVLAPQLSEFMLSNPLLELRIETRSQLSDLVSDGFDLALRFGAPVDSSLVARRLFDVRILTVAAPSYINRCGRPTHPIDIADGKHECILAIDPSTGRPFEWEFHQGKERLRVNVSGCLTLTDASTKIGVCLAGLGIAQVIDIGIESHLNAGELVNLFPDWAEERFPLYVYFPSRSHVPAKVRAFVDFVTTSRL